MRISRHQMFMEIAQVVAKRSTCFRENVGAIIVNYNRVVSIGYNGRATGEPHCEYHPYGKCVKSIHAEINALNQLKNSGYGPSDLYVTHLPCPICTEFIIGAGYIKNVYFQILYGDSEPIYRKFKECNIGLYRVLPSGDITSHDRIERIPYEE